MELPLTKTETAIKSPRRLVIYSPPKTGKTTLAAELDNCLLLDLEDGSDFVKAMRIKAKDYKEIGAICDQIIAQGKPYKYIAVDTTTALEDIAIPLALKLYQRTPMGALYKDNILSLPNGAGYLYLRNAFDMLLEKIQSACDRLILFAHIKDKMVGKKGEEVEAKDISLTGKIKFLVCAGADAIGYLYRDTNKCWITFQTADDIVCGARPVHLRNKKFILSEQDEEGNTTVHWNRIYID